MTRLEFQLDPALDLTLERVIDVPRERIWKAWTSPEHLKQWFTPAPWTTSGCEIDLRPGGIFRTVMRSPEGDDSTYDGCYLEVIENERLVWTSVLLPGYRPSVGNEAGKLNFTAVITMEPHERGTEYRVLVIHGDAEQAKQHDEMGFHEGWGSALDQLVALVTTM